MLLFVTSKITYFEFSGIPSPPPLPQRCPSACSPEVREAAAGAAAHLLGEAVGGALPQHYRLHAPQATPFVQTQMLR